MDTRVLRVDPRRPDPAAVAAAASALRDGLLAAFPTETVYGLACRADDLHALERLREAKGREVDKPFSLHLPDAEALRGRFGPLAGPALRLARRRLPGPLTLVLPDPRGGETGVRVPDDEVARAVLRAAACPVVATSLNAAGEPPAVTGEEAARAAGGRAAVVLDGGPARLGKSSTVVRVSRRSVEVLREGAVPREEAFRDAARWLVFVCTGNLCRSPVAAALAERALAGRLGGRPGEEEPAAFLLGRGWLVLSAGTAGFAGLPATPEARETARARGLDLSRHRSRPLTPALVDEAEQVFTAEAAHRASILAFAPEAAEKVRLLDSSGRDVPDPFGGSAAAYARAAAQMEKAVRERIAALQLEEAW